MAASMAKWLWGAAIFELLLAAMFLVLGILIPVVRFGFFVTAAILFLTGIGLVLWAKAVSRQVAETNRLLQTGLDGTASILSLRQTGMYINNQPQVEMELQIDARAMAPTGRQRSRSSRSSCSAG